MALAGAGARLLPAGFDYKTFMGPTRRGWRLWEPAIRRAAGLGAASGLPDPDPLPSAPTPSARCWSSAPARPAWPRPRPRPTAAAACWSSSSTRTPAASCSPSPPARPPTPWTRARLDALAALDNVTVMTRTTAFGVYDGNVVGALERAWDHVASPPEGAPRQRSWRIHAGRVIHATGATERPLLFAGNDRPGVMLAEAARRYVNHFGVLPGGARWSPRTTTAPTPRRTTSTPPAPT
ncbi:MAG: hypothetical protein U5K43_06265 [Halofilum sp. (in: g-proteobacteria)]|nr:hypothetical protein [Halofilum sp. (in: g-proteobacteria)]